MKIKVSLLSLLFFFSCNSFDTDNSGIATDSSLITDNRYNNTAELRPQGTRLDTLENGLILERIDGLYILQEDMVFTEDGLSFLCPTRSAGRTGSSFYWPGGVVYYTYHSSLSAADTLTCREAMDSIMANSSIVFSPKKMWTNNYVEFKASIYNRSVVGMQGGKQDIELITPSFAYGTIMHEILHALGFFHEQSRTDRDNYIVVNENNIIAGKEHNFQKYTNNYNGMDIGILDFNSIMMYDSYDFSRNGLPTMEKLDGTTFYSQRYYLSDGDKAGIAALYGPPFHRLEHHFLVVEELLSGDTDKVVLSCTDSLIFYADKACTTRAALQHPREIRIRTTNTVCGSATNWNYSTTNYYWTVTIPSGTSAYCLSQWTDMEWYFNSNPYEYDVTTNEVVNYLVP